jgi:hypothetical protein
LSSSQHIAALWIRGGNGSGSVARLGATGGKCFSLPVKIDGQVAPVNQIAILPSGWQLALSNVSLQLVDRQP